MAYYMTSSLCIGCKAGFLSVYVPTFLSIKYTPPLELKIFRTTLWEFNAVYDIYEGGSGGEGGGGEGGGGGWWQVTATHFNL